MILSRTPLKESSVINSIVKDVHINLKRRTTFCPWESISEERKH